MKAASLHYASNAQEYDETNQRRDQHINTDLTYIQNQDLHWIFVNEVSVTPNHLFQNYMHRFADDITNSEYKNTNNNIMQTKMYMAMKTRSITQSYDNHLLTVFFLRYNTFDYLS